MKKLTSLTLLTLIVTLLSASTTNAAVKTWTNTVGSAWTTAANWSPNGAPAAGDAVVITNDLVANITAVPTITLSNLTINGSCTFAAAASGNTITVTNGYSVAAGKTNTIGITGGRLVFTLAATATATVNGNCAFDAGTTVRDFTVSGTLIVNPTGRVYDPSLSAGSVFILNNGATLKIGNTGGISTGTTADTTVAINFGGSYTYNAGAHYEYIGTAAQVTGSGLPATVSSLTDSNSGGTLTMTRATATTVTNFVIATGAKVSLTAGITDPVTTLILGGFIQVSGTWGSSSSTATHKNDTYFAATTGLLNVSTGGTATTTTVATSGTPSTYGNAVTFTATVTPNTVVNGTIVNFYDGVTLLGSGTISGTTTKTAAYTTTATQLNAGSHTAITATFVGDSTFLASTSTAITQTVNKQTPVIAVAPSATAITYGQALSASSLSGGTVTNAAGATLTGVFTFTTPGTVPNAGTANQSVTFTPDASTNYNNATGTASVQVNKAGSSVTVTGTTTFTYSGSPQGPETSDVTGSSGAVTYSYVGTGSTTYGPSATQPTDAGSYTVTASVAADDNYNGASSSATAFTIAQATASFTGLSSVTNNYGVTDIVLIGQLSAAGPVYPANGDAVSATINGFAVSGTVTNSTGGFLIDYNDASLSTNGVSGSPYTITYNYAGNDAVSMASASDNSTTLTIIPTTPVLTLMASGITYGQTLADSSLDGSVATNAENSAQVTGGFAFEDNTIAPNAGTTNVSVIFTPDDAVDYNTVTNNVDVTVNKAESSVTVTGTTTFTYSGSPQGPETSDVTGSSGAVSYSYAGTDSTTYGPSAIQPTDAGSYTVTASVAADDNYNGASSSATAFTINKAGSSVTVTGTTTFTYSGSPQGPETADVTGSSGAVTYSYVGTGSTTYGPSATQPTDAGSYTVTASVAADDNYNGASSSATAFTINKAGSSVTVTGTTTFTYSGSPQGPETSDVTGSSGAVTYSYVGTGSTTYGPSATQPTDAGSYTVTASVAADDNYNGASSSATAFTINKAGSSVTVTGTTTFTYSGSPQGPETSDVTGSSGAVTYSYVGTGSTTYGPSATQPTDAGSYTVTASVAADDNYNGASSSATAFTIAQATASFTGLSSVTNNYGVTDIVLIGQLSAAGPVYPANGDAVSATINGFAVSGTVTNSTGGFLIDYNDASLSTNGVSGSPYTITYNYAGNDAVSMASASDNSTTLTIIPTTPVLTLMASGITYGQTLADSSLDGSVATNAENSAQVTGGFAFEDNTIAPNAGTTNVSVIFTPDDAVDYNTVTNNVDVTVNKAESSVTVTGTTTFTYSGSPQGPETSDVTGSSGAVTYSYVGTGSTTYGPSATQPTDAGSYTVTASVAADDNYNGASSSATAFTINKAGSSVTVTGTTTFTYSGSPQGPETSDVTGSSGAVTYSYVGTGSTTYGPSATQPTDAGSYTVTASVAADDNYNGASSSATAFTINKAGSSVTVTGTTTFTYSGSPQGPETSDVTGSSGAVTYSYVGTGSTTYGPSATQPTDAGSYTVTASVAADDNYNGASSSATAFTIAQATASFTGLSSVTNNYGVTDIVLIGQLSAAGPVYPANGDAVSATINGFAVSGTVTNSTGGFLIDYNDASLSTNGVSGSPYTITYNYAGNDAVSMASASDNSTTLTIIPTTPVLTLMASGITYGQTLADSSLDGSVATNAENSAQVTGGFAFEDNTIAPNAGTTNVSVIFTPDDAVDYNTVTNNVDVTVNKAESSVTVTGTTTFTYSGSPQGPETSDVTGSSGAVTYSYVGTGSTTYGPSAIQPTDAGSYTVTASVAADDNYNGASSSATAFTIAQASTTGAVTSSDNPSLPGTDVTLKMTLTAVAPGAGTPTGDVQFIIDGSPFGSPVALSEGVASLDTSALSHTNHTVVAEYAGDGNFVGSTNSLSPDQIVNTPPVAVADTLGAVENTAFNWATALVLANDTDADGDSLSVANVSAASTQGGMVSLGGTTITYTPPADYVGTDSFTYTVADPFGGTDQGTVTVIVNSPTNTTQKVVGIEEVTDGAMQLTFSGVPGQTYVVEATVSLTEPDWVPISTNEADAYGMFIINDSNASDYSYRFYRSVTE